jgi:hypothetical protein
MASTHSHKPFAKVCFSKDQLLALLQKFVEGLTEPAFQAQMASLSPDEDKIDAFLQDSQILIIRDFLPGIPPNAVFADIGRASQAWPGDEEVLAALANTSLAEERAIALALKKEGLDSNLIQINPQIMKQVAIQAQTDPAAFQKQQQMLQMMYGSVDAMEKLKEHMKAMETSNPEAYALFSQTLAATAFFTPSHEHKHDHPADPAPSTSGKPSKAEFDDMPPLGDSDDDLEDNMA